MKKLIAYIPALHKGYLNLFRECGAKILYIIGDDVIESISELDYVTRKDSLRAVPPEMMKNAVKSLGIFDKVEVFNLSPSNSLKLNNSQIVMPYEDVSKFVAEKYLTGKNVEFYSIFLRWNKFNVEKTKNPSCSEISMTDFEKEIMRMTLEESRKSFDWWRQVGAVVVKNGRVLLTAYNKHLPTEQSPYIFGDPRSVFKKGLNIELSTSEHAEAMLIAEAAKLGISLDGAELFVTDFPCPPCAKLVAGSGIKKCYFIKGYAMLDGEDNLKHRNVEIVKVNPKDL